ncbi:protein maelstrom homolog isoform X2 [Diceros bicornis minor]|uniref:protein maelstrom homolog isoform X2 n=1 Tax=Diceros bicornis minor TaxID=77932 RepID=UPI0026EC47CD|nr:protein maelstrom homolog isoform X2 [Diceros bicornis minor]
MPNRKASRNAYYFFVQEKIPELRGRGLPVARVADAIPYCSADWALLREEEKEKYAEMAREWRAAQGKDSRPEKQKPVSTPLRRPDMLVPNQNVSPPDMSSLSLKSDQGEIPRGFRFHCQTASDSSHKIPISNFESGRDQAIVLQNLYRFIHPSPGNWPPVYCKSDDRAKVNWCLKHMAKASEIRQHLELLTVEDLVVGIYHQKFLKEPSKTWVRSLLDVAMWDYSSNTRCKWHEENDILFCALAVCKKIAYCISNSLATLFGIQLTEAHVPLQDYEASNRVTPKMVVLDAGRYQKLRVESPGFSHFNSSNQKQRSNTPTGDYPCGVKISGQNSSVRGRGITRFLESISNSSSNIHGFSSCETALSPDVSQKDGYRSFSSLS